MRLAAEVLPVEEWSLAEYFGNRLARYARTLRPPPAEETCWYLGRLLERLGRSERLFAWEDGAFTIRPLADLYGDAREARSERERCQLLQQLGDTALFLGALFPERYARRGIGPDYFVGMGSGAYDYLSGNAPRHRQVFAELASGFPQAVEMVADACSRTRPLSDDEVLLLYRRWREERDPLAAAQLAALGIDVDDPRPH